MHRSGISVSKELQAAVQAAAQDGTGFVKLTIQNEAFVIVQKGGSGSVPDRFKAAQSALEEKTACYMLIRGEDKWVLCFYVPESSAVRDKMILSSSRSALKEGIGQSTFGDDFFISNKAECTWDAYVKSQKDENSDNRLLMTNDEIIRKEAHEHSMHSMQKVKVTAIADVPIKVTQSVQDHLIAFKEGKVNAILLTLDSSETLQGEVFTPKADEKDLAEALATKLPAKEPIFALFNHSHKKDDKAVVVPVFAYYCPVSSPPRSKMFYSSCKSMVVKIIESLGTNCDRRIEITEPQELSSKMVTEELYPKAAEKSSFAKPKRAGKGAARLHGSSKFDAQQ